MVLDTNSSLATRQTSLALFIRKNPEGLDEVLFELAGAKGDKLSLDALSALVERKSEKSSLALQNAFESEELAVRQRAWVLAAGIDDASIVKRCVDALVKLKAANGDAPDAIELLESAKQRSEPEVVAALAAYESAMSESKDPLAAWMPALQGGDVLAGEEVFMSQPAAQCRRCHAGGHGQAGPLLDGVATRGDRRFLLESLVVPAAKVAPGYGMVAATMKDGSVVAGVLSEESDEAVVLDVAGKKSRILRSEIAELSEPISAMPPMGAVLSMRELRDLVAWLSEQKAP